MFISLFGAFASTWTLRLWAVPSFLLSVLVMSLGIPLDKTPGEPSKAAYLAAACSSLALAGVFIVWILWTLVVDLERHFRLKPWKKVQERAIESNSKTGAGGVVCSFTGAAARGRKHVTLAHPSPPIHHHDELARPPCTPGLRPNMRCPSCNCYVNEAAFHFRDKMMSFPGARRALFWLLRAVWCESLASTLRVRRNGYG